MKTAFLLVLTFTLSAPSFSATNGADDPKILHAIGVMIQLKLKPKDVTRVLSGTWQRTGQPLSCVYFTRGKVAKVAIAAVGQVNVVSADGREQATLCYPAVDMTGAVKYFAPSYLD